MKKIAILVVSILIFFLVSAVFGEEIYKGVFSIASSKTAIVVNKNKKFQLSNKVKVKTEEGQQLTIEAVESARVIKIVKDSGGKVEELIILGWWD